MDTNLLIVVAATIVVVSSIFTFIMRNKDKKRSKNELNTTKIITTLLNDKATELFQKGLELKKAEENGFDSVKDFVFEEIKTFINETKYFSFTEKILLTSGLAEELLTPVLKKMWDYKLEAPSKNLSKKLVKKLREDEEENNIEE